MKHFAHTKKLLLSLLPLGAIGLSAFSITSCTTPVSISITGGDTTGIGYINHAGSLKDTFLINSNKDVKNKITWSIIKSPNFPNDDISNFYIDTGVVKWNPFKQAESNLTYHFCVKANDTSDKVSATSGTIGVEIKGMAPPVPEPVSGIKVNSNPYGWDYVSEENNDAYFASLESLTLKTDATTHTATIETFTPTSEFVFDYTRGSKSGKTIVFMPRSSYEVDGVEYTITAIGTQAFDCISLSDLIDGANARDIILPSTITSFSGDNCFSGGITWSFGNTPPSIEGQPDNYVDFSKCVNLDCPVGATQADGSVSQDIFNSALINAFIPPTYNQVMHYMYDDMFENAYFRCDLDYSSFVNLENLGHWATRFNMSNVDLDPNGDGTAKAQGNFIIPSSVKIVGWCGFTNCLINNLYWDIDSVNKISFINDNGFHLPALLVNIFSNAIITNLYIHDITTNQQGWKDTFKKLSNNACLPFNCGPNNRPASLTNVLEYPN